MDLNSESLEIIINTDIKIKNKCNIEIKQRRELEE